MQGTGVALESPFAAEAGVDGGALVSLAGELDAGGGDVIATVRGTGRSEP